MTRLLLAALALLVATAAHANLTGGTNISVLNETVSITGQVGVANGGTGLSSIGDDALFVGSGATTVQAKTVPACTDTGGNHLNYDQATNTFSCGTSGASSIPPVIGMGFEGDLGTTQTCYTSASGSDCTNENGAWSISPGATYKNLRCVNGPIAGVGNNIVVTGRSGACGTLSDGSLTCTLTGAGTANVTCSDTTNNIAPTAGQCWDVKVVTPAALTNNARPKCTVERTA